jgi:hypothetical protein
MKPEYALWVELPIGAPCPSVVNFSLGFQHDWAIGLSTAALAVQIVTKHCCMYLSLLL